MLDLSQDFFVKNDQASTTSSTMSDDASWSDSSHGVEDDDMDISQVQPLSGGGRNDSTRSIEEMQSGDRIAPSRSTVSLSALVTHQHQSMRLAPRKAMPTTKHASVRNLQSDRPMRAVQTASARAAAPGDVDPNEYLCKLLQTKLDRVPHDALGAYFLETTPDTNYQSRPAYGNLQ